MSAPQRVRWAVVGTGNIAHRFATDLGLSDRHELRAVGSRTPERAAAFAARCNAPRWHADHDELLASPDVDAVYIAVPHSEHHRLASAAIAAGKAVLLEKPFTLDAAQARDLVERARAADVFLMEAMWTRFLPHMVRIRELLASGRLGDVRLVSAEHGVWFRTDPTHRMFDLRLGGGALLDLGVYPVSFASMVLGAPEAVTGSSTFGPTGADAQTVVVLDHAHGRRAVATSTMEAWLPNRASIAGTDARLDIDPTWYRATSFTVTDRSGASERHEFPVEGTGLRFEADEVARCLEQGHRESAVMPLAESCRIMATMDAVRAQTGLRYPDEDEGHAKKS